MRLVMLYPCFSTAAKFYHVYVSSRAPAMEVQRLVYLKHAVPCRRDRRRDSIDGHWCQSLLSRRLSHCLKCLSTLINAGQTYTINSSYAFRLDLISLRINRLLLSTSVQSLFLILKCSVNHLFSCLIYSNRYCTAVQACLCQHVPALINLDRR